MFMMRHVVQVFLYLLMTSVANSESEKSCPRYPPIAPESVVTPDLGLGAALEIVDSLLQKVTATLPSGLVATVVYNQTVLFSKGYGLRDAFNATSGPPNDQDLVRLASITKVFTDILMYQLRDQGFIDLEDPLLKYMPDFKMKLPPCPPSGCRMRRVITLGMLASHMAGVPRDVPYPCSYYATCNETEVLALLADVMPPLAPGRRFHYSNLGFGLLGRALAHAKEGRHDAYEPLIIDNILRPLGMKDATFVLDTDTQRRMAVGTTVDGSRIHDADWRPCSEGMAWEAPAGSLIGSTSHMASLMKLLFRDDRPADAAEQVLDGDTIHEMLDASTLLADGGDAIGHPWEIAFSSGVWIKSKQAQLPGYRSSVSIVEELKLGVFVTALVTDVEEPHVWSVPILDILVPVLTDILWREAKPAPLPLNYEAYLGHYKQRPPPCSTHADVARLRGPQLAQNFDATADVSVENGTTLILRFSDGTPSFNLSTFVGIEVNDLNQHSLRAEMSYNNMSCRERETGGNMEVVTFVGFSEGRANTLRFLDSLYQRSDSSGISSEGELLM